MGRAAEEGPIPLNARSASLPAAVGLAAVLALGLAVRLAWLRQDSTFQRTDEIMFVLNALRLDGAGASAGAAARELFWLLAFPWGYPVVLFLYGVLAAYGWLGIPITEFSTVAPFAVIGALGPVLVYVLARRAFPVAAALLAATAVAVLPSHVAQSRTVASWLLASDLMMLTLLAFWRYLEMGRRRDALLFGLALAVYLPSDNLAPGTLAVLAAVALGWHRGRIVPALRALFRPAAVVLPALSLAALVAVQVMFVAKGRPTYGLLGHYLMGKVEHGVHVGPVLAALWANSAPALVVLLAVGVVRAPLSLIRPGREWIVLVWLLGFLLPTLLLIDPRGTVLAAYLTPVIVPLLVFGAAGVVETVRWLAARGRMRAARLAAATAVAVFVVALAALLPRVYARALPGIAPRPIGLWGGEQYSNDGAKTAGYWMRTKTPPGTVVLSDLRLFVGKYYFHRPTIAPGDPRFEPAGFGRVRDRVDVIAVTAGWLERADAGGYLDGFHRVLTVTHGGRPTFVLYARRPAPAEVWATEELDRRFDREFGRVKALRYPLIWEDDLPPLSG